MPQQPTNFLRMQSVSAPRRYVPKAPLRAGMTDTERGEREVLMRSTP
jgi:hypothetical protein